ncbi:MAG: hypothetical protein ACYDAO_04285 [Thermoplasmataceae archaeon]
MANYRELEIIVEKLLSKDGYLTERARYNAKKIGNKWLQHKLDFFHVFDLIAIKLPGPVRFIQVCVEGQVSAHKKKIDDLFKVYPMIGAAFTVEIIVPEKEKNRWKISKTIRRVGDIWVNVDI